MKRTLITALAGLCAASIGLAAFTQTPATLTESLGLEAPQDAKKQKAVNKDVEQLYEMVQQIRAELEGLRKQAGLPARESRGEHAEGGREGRGEHGGRASGGEHGGREGRGEHGGREGRGEHGAREGRGAHSDEGGEEGGQRIAKNQVWDNTRNGAHLILAYDSDSQSFKGTVENRTKKTLSVVRVEVHLSNGVELGPTKRIDLKPGKKIPVELSAASQKFDWWTTHAEHGTEEGHGPGHEEGGDEHGGGRKNDKRPKDASLRPLYNQILLLQREVELLREDLRAKKR